MNTVLKQFIIVLIYISNSIYSDTLLFTITNENKSPAIDFTRRLNLTIINTKDENTSSFHIKQSDLSAEQIVKSEEISAQMVLPASINLVGGEGVLEEIYQKNIEYNIRDGVNELTEDGTKDNEVFGPISNWLSFLFHGSENFPKELAGVGIKFAPYIVVADGEKYQITRRDISPSQNQGYKVIQTSVIEKQTQEILYTHISISITNHNMIYNIKAEIRRHDYRNIVDDDVLKNLSQLLSD